jgi:hypothetical protein
MRAAKQPAYARHQEPQPDYCVFCATIDDHTPLTLNSSHEANMQTSTNGRTGEPRITETATEARQGVTGHNVRRVLLFGTAGVIVAFVILWLLFFGR